MNFHSMKNSMQFALKRNVFYFKQKKQNANENVLFCAALFEKNESGCAIANDMKCPHNLCQ